MRDYAEILQRFRASCTIRTLDREMAPQALITSGPGPQKKGEHCGRGNTVDTTRIQQPHRDHLDESPDACNDGWLAPLGRAHKELRPLYCPWPRFSYPASSVAVLFLPHF